MPVVVVQPNSDLVIAFTDQQHAVGQGRDGKGVESNYRVELERRDSASVDTAALQMVAREWAHADQHAATECTSWHAGAYPELTPRYQC